jgi:hypothetical protein
MGETARASAIIPSRIDIRAPVFDRQPFFNIDGRAKSGEGCPGGHTRPSGAKQEESTNGQKDDEKGKGYEIHNVFHPASIIRPKAPI